MSLPSGQYNDPLSRPTFVEAPVVAAFATMRLRVNLQFSGTGTSPSLTDNLITAIIENTSDTAVTAQLRQVGDYASGLPTNGTVGTKSQTAPYRSNVGAPFTLVPAGHKTFTLTPTQQYLELWGVSGGPGFVRCQFNGLPQLSEMAFAKDDPTYPPQLWEPPDLG